MYLKNKDKQSEQEPKLHVDGKVQNSLLQELIIIELDKEFLSVSRILPRTDAPAAELDQSHMNQVHILKTRFLRIP
jgi:hypothetical protein